VQIRASEKIKLKKEENFRSRKSVRQHTTIHQQHTTISPSKNHVLHAVFAKPLQKHHSTTDLKKSSAQTEI